MKYLKALRPPPITDIAADQIIVVSMNLLLTLTTVGCRLCVNLLERVFLLEFVLAMLDTLCCNDTINWYNGFLNHGLVAVEVVAAEFCFPAKYGSVLRFR